MAELILVHGSGHGAWCWRDVLAELGAMGRTARAIDLPGHGDDPTPRGAVTLDLYARAIVAAIDGEAVLVGHSMAGYPITAAALMAPEKVRLLVYLCAYVPEPGRSLREMRKDWPDQPLASLMRPHEDGVSTSFDPERVAEIFYHDCPPEAQGYARARLTPQPGAPQAEPFGPALPDVARHYIVCTEDRAIPPARQEHMVRDWPDARVERMECGHSPFLAAPAELARRLAALATRAD